jgi:hypothetical protein
MHPLLYEAMVEARQADLERAGRAPRLVRVGRVRRHRRPTRVAVGMRLIDVGLRLVDIAPSSPAC